MAIPDSELQKAKDMIENAARPIFFHDDDPDGIASFVSLYQFAGEGKVVTVKNSPKLTAEYLRKVDEYSPDLIVLLDKPMIDEEFLQGTNTPVLWIDHHAPQTELVSRYPNVTYLNPRISDDADNRPTSYWAYKITGKNLWLSVAGCIGDWYIPEFIDEFKKLYGDLLPEEYEDIEKLYLDTGVGKLIRVLQFNLKGTVSDVRKSILTLTRIESPYEILNQTTTRGRFLWRKYKKLADSYDKLLSVARESADSHPGKMLVFIYESDNQTFTMELSNELLIRYPDRITLVGRHHEGRYKCSLRSKGVTIPDKLAKALEGLDGHGGGHANACGASIAEDDWETFKERFSGMF